MNLDQFFNLNEDAEYMYLAKAMTLSSQINRWMKIKKITPTGLAELTGVTLETVEEWLKAEHNMTLFTISRIEQALGEKLLFIKKAPNGPRIEDDSGGIPEFYPEIESLEVLRQPIPTYDWSSPFARKFSMMQFGIVHVDIQSSEENDDVITERYIPGLFEDMDKEDKGHKFQLDLASLQE